MDLLRPTVFCPPKTLQKVAITKTESTTIAFFSSPPFFLLALSFSPFLFLRYCDFGASRQSRNLPFDALFTQMTANFVTVGFQKIG